VDIHAHRRNDDSCVFSSLNSGVSRVLYIEWSAVQYIEWERGKEERRRLRGWGFYLFLFYFLVVYSFDSFYSVLYCTVKEPHSSSSDKSSCEKKRKRKRKRGKRGMYVRKSPITDR
jgi:hypothetical protein